MPWRKLSCFLTQPLLWVKSLRQTSSLNVLHETRKGKKTKMRYLLCLPAALKRLPYIPQKCHINFIVVCQIHRKLSASQPTHRLRSVSPAQHLGLFQAAEWSDSSPSASLPCGEPCRRSRCCFRTQPVASEEIIFGKNSQLCLVQLRHSCVTL